MSRGAGGEILEHRHIPNLEDPAGAQPLFDPEISLGVSDPPKIRDVPTEDHAGSTSKNPRLLLNPSFPKST